MKKETKIILIFFVGLTLFEVFFSLLRNHKSTVQKEEIVKVDTIIRRDTVSITKPIVKYKTTLDTILIPVRVNDTVSILTPIVKTQGFYSDSLYNAWVSGYEPSLDSIRIFNKTIYIDSTKTVEKIKVRRLGICPSIGVGYGINGFTPYIGIGINFNIFKIDR